MNERERQQVDRHRERETGKECRDKLQQERNKQEQNAHRNHLEQVIRQHEMFSYGIRKGKNAKNIPAIKDPESCKKDVGPVFLYGAKTMIRHYACLQVTTRTHFSWVVVGVFVCVGLLFFLRWWLLLVSMCACVRVCVRVCVCEYVCV